MDTNSVFTILQQCGKNKTRKPLNITMQNAGVKITHFFLCRSAFLRMKCLVVPEACSWHYPAALNS